MKLHLCCGTEVLPELEDHVGLDADPAVKPHILARVPPIPLDANGERWESIDLIHGIEHFHLWEAEELLASAHEVLAPGGVLALEQPDIEKCALVLLGYGEVPGGMERERFGIFGLYGEPIYKNPLMGHHWGWTPKTLTGALRKAGFAHIEQTVPKYHYKQRDFRLEARL